MTSTAVRQEMAGKIPDLEASKAEDGVNSHVAGGQFTCSRGADLSRSNGQVAEQAVQRGFEMQRGQAKPLA